MAYQRAAPVFIRLNRSRSLIYILKCIAAMGSGAIAGKEDFLRRHQSSMPGFLQRPRSSPSTATGTERELPLSDPVREFKSPDRDCCSRNRLETSHPCAPMFDRTVVLFHDIVEILRAPD